MKIKSNGIICKSHRGLSQIIGGLFLLAVVVSIGSVLLLQGIDEVNSFNKKLAIFSEDSKQSPQEDLIFENIRFVPLTKEVNISVLNTGTIDVTINRIVMVKVDTQEIIIDQDNLGSLLLIQDDTQFQYNGTLTQGTLIWKDEYYADSQYKISIGTARGNFFDTIARPYNT